jgi:hypothetical protein
MHRQEGRVSPTNSLLTLMTHAGVAPCDFLYRGGGRRGQRVLTSKQPETH